MVAFLLLMFAAATHSVIALIESIEATITNPMFPNHEIPVFVYYPSFPHNATIFPTIVFAHGFECPSIWYSWIYRNLVPNGYIVAYVNSYAGGKVNQTQFAIDQRYTLQWLNTIVNNNRSSPLYHAIDTTRSMAAGHSEGGGASILSAGSDTIDELFKYENNFNSIFLMAPCGQHDDSIFTAAQHVAVPAFVFTASMDCICPSEEAKRLYHAIPTSTCKYLSEVSNGTHCKWMNPSGPTAHVCHDLEVGICKVLRPKGHKTITEMQQIAIGVEYINLFISATIADSGNVQDFTKIAIDLNTAESNGAMADIKISDVCLNYILTL